MRTQTRAPAGRPVVADEVDAWPELPWQEWAPTADTLHMFTQVLGKLRLSMSPSEPHWAHVPLYVTVSGLTTGPMAYGERYVQADLDLTAHRLWIADSSGQSVQLPLVNQSVARFYHNTMDALGFLGVQVTLNTKPQEVPNPVPFPEDTVHHDYDPHWVLRFHRVLLSMHDTLSRHRAEFHGIQTPVGLYWGSFDLAYTRYSGRPADPPDGANMINREAMNAEQVTCGFWPGDAANPAPAVFAFAYPSPSSLDRAHIEPPDAAWNPELGEFVLPYDAVRAAPSPQEAVLAFLRATFRAAAVGAGWPEAAR